MTQSPYHSLVINASAVHHLITANGDDELQEVILSVLARNHGVKHVGEMDVLQVAYKEWIAANPASHKAYMSLSEHAPSAKDSSASLPVRPLYMELGNQEELAALKAFELSLNGGEPAGKWVVSSDQQLRTLTEGNITIRGRFDALIQRETDSGKRVTKGIVEVKTRLQGFYDNPADKTQLSIYSRMAPNAASLLYLRLEYNPYEKTINKTAYTYAELQEHWKSFVYPNLHRLYPAICATWLTRMQPESPSWIGHVYLERMTKLLDRFLTILRNPQIDGDVVLIQLLDSSKNLLRENVVDCYNLLAHLMTPTIVWRVRNRDLTFFRENAYDLLQVSRTSTYGSYVSKYSDYITGLVSDNLTETTRESLWKLVEDVIATV